MKKVAVILILISVLCIFSFGVTSCDKAMKGFVYDPDTDYGVYWYGEGSYIRSSSKMSNEYYDPSKPTFVFCHGWEPDSDNTTNGYLEDLVTHKDTIAKTGADKVNYADALKEQGYNVACLGWFAYAKNLGDLFRYIWVDFDGGYALSLRFAQELCLVLGESYENDVRFVGHSYGSQLAVATSYQLVKFKEKGEISNQHLIPTRMTLADPYIGQPYLINGWAELKESNISYIGEPIGRLPKKLISDTVSYIVEKSDMAVDIYCGMSIASTSHYKYDGSDRAFEQLSKNCAFVKSKGLKNYYGDTNIHNIVRDWVLMTIIHNLDMIDQNGNKAPSGGASDEEIKLMRGKCFNQKNLKYNVFTDSMEFVDRDKTAF